MSSTTAPEAPKSKWIARFDGPILRRGITLGSPLVRHQFNRSFEHVGRNVHMVSVFGRVLLGEEKINEAEEAIYKRITEITTAIERKVESSKFVVDQASLAGNLAIYNKPTTLAADVVVPAQGKFITLLELADKYAQHFFTLWLAGEISDKEKSKLEFELKKMLRSIPATTRKMRIFIQEKLNASEHEEAKREAQEMVSDIKEDDVDAIDAEVVDPNADPLLPKVARGKAKAKAKSADAAPAAPVPAAAAAPAEVAAAA